MTTDRRETNRKRGQQSHTRTKAKPTHQEPDWSEGERIAKYLARSGIASRRAVEGLIEAGAVTVNGRKLTTPAFKVTGLEDIKVHGKRVSAPAPIRLWRYHKPSGLISTTHDPEGRRTIFEELPKSLPRTITIGRLDLTTEGLLLLTNDGGLARAMELPRNSLRRYYRARAHGKVTQADLDTLATGVTTEDGTKFGSILATLERETGTNNWISVELTEGKNREVRKALEHLGLKVNRLIRTDYGPFELSDLKPGAVEEISLDEMQEHLSPVLPDFKFDALERQNPPSNTQKSGRRYKSNKRKQRWTP